MKSKKGDKVKVQYEGRFENGEIFDSSEFHDKPLIFEIGAGMVVPGFDSAVLGMEVGEEKEFKLEPKEAYGERREEAVYTFPKNKFPPEAKEGMMVALPLPNGQEIPARITKISDSDVTIDLNHPLAGKTLIFKIKLLDILPKK